MKDENKFNVKKTPLSIEQASNYLKSEDFKENAEKGVEKAISGQADPKATHISQTRALKVGLAELNDYGYELQYKKLLNLKLHGATYSQIATSINKPIAYIKILEKQALDCVKDKLGSRMIIQVV